MKKESIVVVQKGKTDSDGDQIEPPQDSPPINGVVIWPRASEEKDGGVVSVDGDNLALPDSPAAQAIGNEDWLRYRGALYQVDEPPSRYIGKKIMVKTKKVGTG